MVDADGNVIWTRPYSRFSRAKIFSGDVPQMSFYFEKYDNHSEPYERAIVHVSIHPEYPILKVDVDLDSLPDKE